MESKFDDIRPYYDTEIPAAMQRIINDPFFIPTVHFLFPNRPVNDFVSTVRNISSADELQAKVMHPIIQSIVSKTMTEFTFDGIENLTRDRGMLFISNHRDIVMDSFLTQYMLFLNSVPTGEITFGDNLMSSQFVIDVGRSNKMYKVIRKQDATPREFLANSIHLSEYIRYTISQKNTSSWIAQRNGRTKDGCDTTDQGLLKMLGLSGSKELVASFEGLHITPLSISYELEPCDMLKVKEMLVVQSGVKYIKSKNEDFNSILIGITQPKGKVHLSVCKPITKDDLQRIQAVNSNDFLRQLAELIDGRIRQAYRLYPNNYVAADLLADTQAYASHYTPAEKALFESYMHKQFETIPDDTDPRDKAAMRRIFLGIYANPLFNKSTC